MNQQPRLVRIIDWLLIRLPVIPLVMTFAFLYIFQESHLVWAYRWLQLSFGMFLLMPGWLLLFRPNLTIATINSVYAFLFTRRNTLIEPVIKKDWQHLGSVTKAILLSICAISFLAGALLFRAGLQIP